MGRLYLKCTWLASARVGITCERGAITHGRGSNQGWARGVRGRGRLGRSCGDVCRGSNPTTVTSRDRRRSLIVRALLYTHAEATRERLLVTKSCDETGSNRGYRPMQARWRSTAAMAAAVIASVMYCIKGGELAPGTISVLSSAAREGRRGTCSRRLDTVARLLML